MIAGPLASTDSGDLLLAASGEQRAFPRILQRWKYPVFAVFERGREPSAATEEAVEVFAELFRRAPEYQQEPFATWLFSLVWKRLESEPAAAHPSIPAARLAESAAARTALLREAVSSLPPDQRAALLFSLVAGLPSVTSAAVLGLPEPELAQRLTEAMRSLEQLLAPLFDMSSARVDRALDMSSARPQRAPDAGPRAGSPTMACPAVREALARGASGGAVAEHLSSCPRCQETARRYGDLRRFYSLDAAGEQPADFDRRVLARIAEAPSVRRGVSPLLLGALLLVVAGTVVAVVLSRPSAPRAAGHPPAATPIAAAPATADGLPAPPDVDEGEKARTLARPELELLRSFDMMAGLDVFFPESYGPLPPATVAAPALSADELWARVDAWRRLPAAERRRFEELERRFAELPPDRQRVLRERWLATARLDPEERAGMRRLSARLGDLDGRRRARLALDLRALQRDVAPRRVARWRALPFAKGLTGQELAAGERLLDAAQHPAAAPR